MKTPLWLVRRYFRVVDRDDDGFVYECLLCGKKVRKNERHNHLRFKHPLIWARIEKEAEAGEQEKESEEETEY